MSELKLLLPEAIVFLMMVFVLLLDIFTKKDVFRLQAVYSVSQVSLLIAAIAAYTFLGQEKTFAFGHAYVVDNLAIFVKIFILFTTFLALSYARRDSEEKWLPSGEFHVLSLAAVLGMMVLVSAGSLLTLYLGLELLSLSLYTLVAMRRDQILAVEAGMKYFVMGAVASIVMLYGISILYGFSGTFEMDKIWAVIQEKGTPSGMLVMGMVFILAGAAFKLGLVPFHLWLPDVYQGAPASVVALISSAPKIAAFGMLMRILLEIFPELITDWQQILMVLSVLSIAIGNVFAVVQSNLKRMLGYSAIAQMGYFLLGILAGTSAGYAAAFFYMITYALVIVGALGAIALFSKDGVELSNIEDFKGLGLVHPWYGLVLMLFMFSLAGVPPLVGFYAKFLVLKSVMAVDLTWLAVYGVIFAVIGAFYYLRVIKALFFESPISVSHVGSNIAIALETKTVLLVNAVLVLFAGIFPSTLLTLCRGVF